VHFSELTFASEKILERVDGSEGEKVKLMLAILALIREKHIDAWMKIQERCRTLPAFLSSIMERIMKGIIRGKLTDEMFIFIMRGSLVRDRMYQFCCI
jgi:hypothetical protein